MTTTPRKLSAAAARLAGQLERRLAGEAGLDPSDEQLPVAARLLLAPRLGGLSS